MKHQITSNYPVIDFGLHHHPLNQADQEEGGTLEGYIDPARRNDATTVLGEYRDGDVDAMVSSNPYYMNHDDLETVVEANDVLQDRIEEYDELYGLASIPTCATDGERAAEEFERRIDDGFQGGALAETQVNVTDAEMEPVLEVADRTGAPIMVHIPDMPIVDYRFNATFARERAQQESISRVIHEEIYDRYSGLNLVWHHLGGNIASMMGRIHLQTDAGRWPQPDMKPFSEYKEDLENRVYIDTSGYFGYSAPIRTALEELPSTQVLFGTDYPAEPRSGDELAGFVETILESGTQRDAERILGQNALDLMVNVE